MTSSRHRFAMWGAGLTVAFLTLGASRAFCAEESPASTAPPESVASSGESGSPDAPPPSSGQAPKNKASRMGGRSDFASGTSEAPVSRGGETSRQVPEEEAPSIGGPSGSEFGAVEAAPSRGEPERQAPEEEAPALGGPSGGEQPLEEAAAGPFAPWWTRVPNIQPFPPPGNTIVPPRGAGYYTLWELLTGDRREAPPRYAYPRFGLMLFSFYNADFRYLDTADDRDRDYFDFLKRIPVGDDFLFTTGGEFRYRYNNEVDSRLTGKDNVYDLTRTRIYADLWYRDLFRIYAEFINAQSFDQDLPPLSIDQYNPNFLNLFADAKLATIRNQPLYLRGGRQELLYGSQRLISPLDWGNTRRTFQGGKLFWQNNKFSLDVFCVQPVVPSANSFASVDWQQVFSGVWGTYRPIAGELIDLYYLNFQDSTQIYAGENGVKGTENVSTVGSRWYGNKNDWLWDTEGMLQFGRYSNQGIMANAYTMGGGYNFRKLPLNPTVWVYYDHASGQPGPPGSTSVHQTFDQLFPFGHYYFGMMDITGRQNINDFHTDLSFFPTKWWTVWAQYHVLRLDSPFDALYNSAGVATRIDPTGKAGINVGDILTVINNFTIDLHQNVFVQYSHLYAGDFLLRTGKTGSADELYVMYGYRW
ncbi:MAG TPA: alginate export family protein [Gemmataceae bacterium]|nr:alginate export family protein [Gemmataceae bacterium]